MDGSLLHSRAIQAPQVAPPSSICGACKLQLHGLPFLKVACSCYLHLACIEHAFRVNSTSGNYRPRFECPSCSSAVYCDVFIRHMKLPHVIPSGDLAHYIDDCHANGMRPVNVLFSLSRDVLSERVNWFIVPEGWSELVTICRLVNPPFLLRVGKLFPLSRVPWVFNELTLWSDHVHSSDRHGPIPPFPWPPQDNVDVSIIYPHRIKQMLFPDNISPHPAFIHLFSAFLRLTPFFCPSYFFYVFVASFRFKTKPCQRLHPRQESSYSYRSLVHWFIIFHVRW